MKLVRVHDFSDSTPRTWKIMNLDEPAPDVMRLIDDPREIAVLDARLEELRSGKIAD